MEDRQMLREYIPQKADSVKLQDIRRWFEATAYQVKTHLPDGREKSLALTKLEEASMWAVKAETHKV